MITSTHRVNFVYSLILIACGIGGFFIRYASFGYAQPTALIPFIVGMLLLVMTPGIKVENRIIEKAVIAITLLFGLMVGLFLIRELSLGDITPSKGGIFAIITLSSFVCFGIYTKGLMFRKKERGN